jgi:hypothetical protein
MTAPGRLRYGRGRSLTAAASPEPGILPRRNIGKEMARQASVITSATAPRHRSGHPEITLRHQQVTPDGWRTRGI